MIRFQCSACDKSMTVKDSAAGRQGKCTGCGEPVIVPSLSPTPKKYTINDAAIIQKLNSIFRSLSEKNQEKLFKTRFFAWIDRSVITGKPSQEIRSAVDAAGSAVGIEVFPEESPRPIPYGRIWGIISGVEAILAIGWAVSGFKPFVGSLQFSVPFIAMIFVLASSRRTLFDRDRYVDALIDGLTGTKAETEILGTWKRRVITTKYSPISDEERLERIRAAGEKWTDEIAQSVYHKRAIRKAMIAPIVFYPLALLALHISGVITIGN